MSNVVDKVKEKVEHVLHKDKHSDEQHTATGATGSHTLGSTGPATSTAGPHGSNVANKTDPRVDSDLDGSRNAGLASTHGHNTRSTPGTGATNTAGPHDSNLANKADPRVDSDMDGSRNAGLASHGPGAHHTGTHTGTGTGLTGSQHTGTTTGAGLTGTSDNAGPHSSNLANKADPRVDSDLDGSRNAGMATYGAGAAHTAGAHHSAGNTAGPHDSNLANKADPRVDSDMDGSRNAGMSTHGPGSHNTGLTGGANTGLTGTGPAPNTAGPHGSNLANKLDPRVDSDLDGSKTVGNTTQY